MACLGKPSLLLFSLSMNPPPVPPRQPLRVYLEPAQPDSYQGSYGRLRDLPPEQAKAFRQWMRENHVWQPLVPNIPDAQQDGFYLWDYDKWRVEDLHHDREEVVTGEMFSGLVLSVRDIVLALPAENLAAFAFEHARHTRCSNLLDVLESTEELVRLSARYYLREFRGWRETAARGDEEGERPEA